MFRYGSYLKGVKHIVHVSGYNYVVVHTMLSPSLTQTVSLKKTPLLSLPLTKASTDHGHWMQRVDRHLHLQPQPLPSLDGADVGGVHTHQSKPGKGS